MKEKLSILDQRLLAVVARHRGLRAKTARRFSSLEEIPSDEAATKKMERLTYKGFLAQSALPAGPKLFRLSEKGVRFANAPKCWAKQPTAGMAAEMLSSGAVGWRLDEQVFMMNDELQDLSLELTTEPLPAQFPGRFIMRTKRSDGSDQNEEAEIHVHFWFCELRTSDQILARVRTIFDRLSKTKLFAELIELRLFGFSIAVPSNAAKAALNPTEFPAPTEILVIEELKDVLK